MTGRNKFPLLPRKKHADKSHFGHVLIVAGSVSYPGAAILCSRASTASGAGLTTLMVPDVIQNAVYKTFPPEVILSFAPSTRSGGIAFRALPKIIEYVRRRRISVVVLGPGLSRDPQCMRLARALVNKLDVPLVVDADALASFGSRWKSWKDHRMGLVLTPHVGEFKRLFRMPAPKDYSQRKRLLQFLSQKISAVLVLKSHDTDVSDGIHFYRNQTGNPGMAKGGSGDVLSGVIGAFIAQGLSVFDAAKWAVYFHGLAGDLALKKKGELSLVADDLVFELPKAFRKKTR
jgi:hydroxyethylthiazole kinase-like uncharacterized protein yjeF